MEETTPKNLHVIPEEDYQKYMRIKKANSLADELAEKDPDASIEILVNQLKEKFLGKDEFETARILTPLFGGGNGGMILKMISDYLSL